jgi:hypothetical protein
MTSFAIAGADAERAQSYQDQSREALAALTESLEPVIVSRRRLALNEYEKLPAFAFAEAPLTAVIGRVAAPVAFLLVLAIALFLIATRALRGPLERTFQAPA